ncbi:MAG TPA: two-component regulator propeller domain-containing protein [Lutibacter sp.]|nr:two-component regulator propeller domain-containing protein [Lutibacter sp.]
MVFYLVALGCYGQSQVKFDKIDIAKGLSSNRISSIVKEKGGFAWIGTDNGLNRYDGSELKVFNKQNSSISSNSITDLLIDRKGRLWIATLDGGLNQYNQEKNTFKVYKKRASDKSALPSNHLFTLFEDSKGNLWIGTENGLSVYKESSNTFITYSRSEIDQNAISNDIVTSIFEDSKGIIWIGTFGGGLNKFHQQTNRFETVNNNSAIFTDFIHTINELDEKTLLIGTKGSGLLKLDKNTLKFSDFFTGPLALNNPPGIIRSVYKDSKENFWIGTDGNGIFKIDQKIKNKPAIINYLHNAQFDASLSGNAVYEIMEDDESNIWIGTAWNGINILNPNYNYEYIFSDIFGKNLTPVLSIYKNEKYLFIGLDGEGLTAYNLENKEVKQFNSKFKSSIGGEYVQHIYESRDGTIWIGTFANGLIKYDVKTQTFKQYKHIPNNPKSLSFNDVRSIVEDDFSNLWIATWGGGLNYFNRETEEFVHYRENKNNQETIGSDNILTIKKDGNQLWLATFGGGLSCFNTDTQKSKNYKYDEKNSKSISSDYVFSLLLDANANLWVGTSGGGVNLFSTKKKEFNRFENNEDIRYQSITGLVEDNNNHIWLSSKRGIYRFDNQKQTFTDYSKIAGEYNINAVFKDEIGLLYFGTTIGVVRFNPNTLLNENVQPQVKITNFKLFNKELPIGENEILTKSIGFEKQLTLKHNLNVITFEFSALRFPFATKCEYSIKMEGFDEDWRNIGEDRTVTYTNLSPGNYTFMVKSREKGSSWGKTYTSLEIEILKPFWLTWWAIVFYGILIILTFYLFRKYIIAWEQMKTNLKLEKFNHEKDIEIYNLKQQFFTNISHDIRTPVTLILGAVNRIIGSSEINESDQTSPINTIKKNCNHLIKLMNELLDFRKLDQKKLKVTNNDFVKFCNEIYLSFTEMAFQKNIEFIFESTNPKIELWFDKNDIEKVLYNILSNAFKFTDNGGVIKILISETATEVQLELIDKGIGISKKDMLKIFNRFYKRQNYDSIKSEGWGLGLAIAKEIIERHHGEISVESKKGQGSNFKIQLKKGKEHFNATEIDTNETGSEDIENYFIDKSLHIDKTEINNNLEIIPAKKQNILIVEDNPDIRKYIAEVVSEEFNIMEASNGKEALILANSKAIDLIISDVMMPVMDGITLTRQIKATMDTSHIPVILLTARSSFIHKIEGFDTGADDYVSKPFNESLLMSRIKSVLRNRQLLHQKFEHKELIPISELNLNRADEEFMKKLIKVIDTHIHLADLNAQFVCNELGMSHSVVYKKIKGLTNMTYVEFVRDYKLKTAKNLIANHHFSVLDACYHVGYSDRKYFSKLFKNHFGKVPSDYINKND